MRNLTAISVFFSLLCVCSVYSGTRAQHAAAHHPYLLQRNTGGERLFFVPTNSAAAAEAFKGHVVTLSEQQILQDGLQPAFVLQAGPAIELFGNFTLFGREDTAMSQGINQYSYSLYTFDQRGEFLYHPYLDHDHFPDAWQQGRRRIVAHGKMGLVNRLGEVIIPARDYNYLRSAKWGLVIACRECRVNDFEYAEGTDAGDYVADYRRMRYDVCTLDGQLLSADRPYDSLPQTREAAEALIRKRGAGPNDEATVNSLGRKLLQLPEVQRYLKEKGGNPGEYVFVLYDRPSQRSPFYLFGLESYRRNTEPATGCFLISADGSEIFNLRYDLQLEMPYREWIKLPEEGRFADNW